MSTLEQLNFNNSFAELPEIFFSRHQPQALKDDFLIHFNETVANLLDLDKNEARRDDFLDVYTARKNINGFKPLAMCYAGHPPEWAQQIEVSCSS